MHKIDRRVHLLLDEPRYRKVAGEARRQGVSVAAVIREAIDRLPEHQEARRIAVAGILAAEPMPLPSDATELRRELDAAHEERP